MDNLNLTKAQARRIGWEMPTSQRGIFMEKNNLKQYEIHATRFLSLETLADLQKLLRINLSLIEYHVNNPEYKEFFIPKKRGGQRRITAPGIHLKAVQKTLNYYLQAVYLSRRPECSHGFIIHPKDSDRTFNIVSNAAPHAGKRFVMNIDIEDFFPSISAKRVKELFSGPQFEFKETVSIVLALLSTYNKHLPVGAPASPVIANMICFEMDMMLMNICGTQGISYTRYADDLTFSSDPRFEPECILEIKQAIAGHGFWINEKKFRVQSTQSKQTVTGLVVNKKPNVDRRYIRKLRATMHHWKTEGLDNAAKKHLNISDISNEDRSVFTQKINGSINFVGMVRGKSDIVYRKLNATFQNFFEPFDHSIQLEMWKRPY
jgi:RNA-directed DNA polymerase